MLNIFGPPLDASILNQPSLSNKCNEDAVFLVQEVTQKTAKEICEKYADIT